MSFAYPIAGVKNSIELPFRAIRIGTLRAYPAESSNSFKPLTINSCGLTIPMCFETSSDIETIKLPANSIQSVHGHLTRGCPALWIKPTKSWAKEIKKKYGLNANNRPHIDPDSDVTEEHEVCIIPDQDPIPLDTQLSIKQIFFGIADDLNIRPSMFYYTISQKDNNYKLVKSTNYIAGGIPTIVVADKTNVDNETIVKNQANKKNKTNVENKSSVEKIQANTTSNSAKKRKYNKDDCYVPVSATIVPYVTEANNARECVKPVANAKLRRSSRMKKHGHMDSYKRFFDE